MSHLPVWRLAAPFVASVLLAACGSSGDDAPTASEGGDDHGHESTHIDSLGRLALIEAGSTTVRIVDLDDKATIARINVTAAPSAIVASPGKRYALAVQRMEDRVEFIDGGLWQEDHVDHLHDYEQAPAKSTFTLNGIRPTHYEVHDDLGAVHMDGDATRSLVGGVRVLSDAGIGRGAVDASLDLPIAVHGTAEPRGEYLLTTGRSATAPGTLPDQVVLQRRSGSAYSVVRTFTETCPDLHGSYSNENHTVFGCSDGVLVVTQTGDAFDARKIANPAGLATGVRIGTVLGHHERDGFVGVASPGALFAIDPVAGTITPISWATGRTLRAQTFDGEGENFLALDDLGVTYVLDATRNYAVRSSIATIGTMPTAAPFPALTPSLAGDHVYVSDPVGRSVAVIDTTTLLVDSRIALDFSPSGITWLGIARHAH